MKKPTTIKVFFFSLFLLYNAGAFIVALFINEPSQIPAYVDYGDEGYR